MCPSLCRWRAQIVITREKRPGGTPCDEVMTFTADTRMFARDSLTNAEKTLTGSSSPRTPPETPLSTNYPPLAWQENERKNVVIIVVDGAGLTISRREKKDMCVGLLPLPPFRDWFQVAASRLQSDLGSSFACHRHVRIAWSCQASAIVSTRAAGKRFSTLERERERKKGLLSPSPPLYGCSQSGHENRPTSTLSTGDTRELLCAAPFFMLCSSKRGGRRSKKHSLPNSSSYAFFCARIGDL